MEGAGSATETLQFLDFLAHQVPRLVLIEGNHDRPALRRGSQLIPHHEEPGFVFHHGHQPLSSKLRDKAGIVVIGHHHPAHLFRDGAGLRLKLPALIQESLEPEPLEQWVLPAFSPWAAGGSYASHHPRLATWVCGPQRVWRVGPSPH
jgi:hypothetical protein